MIDLKEDDVAPSSTLELRNIRNALDQSAIVAITDRAGTIIHVNDMFCEISKFSREELLGQNHRLVNSKTHPPEFFINMWKTIARGHIWVGEVCNRAKDGSLYWVHTSIVPFLSESGRPYQYVSIRFDITSRKLGETQLAYYAKQLESRNRELQDFASVAAHDLQEPLRKVQAFATRLQTKCSELLNDTGKEYVEKIRSSTNRMQALIDDLLTFSRISTRAQPFQTTSLDDLARDVISDLEIRIEKTNAKIEIGTLPNLQADAIQMRQLFQNLISNAIKFAKKDVPPIVKISAEVEDSLCRLYFADNGIGFDEKYLDRIFTIFQRLHEREEYEGTGVGLAVCKRIVERHNGSITAKSSPGAGATFIITLPLIQN